MKACVVSGCGPRIGVSLHRFPYRDPDLLSKWLRLCARRANEINASSRICQLHFTADDYQQNIERKGMLHRWAYPSINLPQPLPEDADLGLVEPLRSVSISDDSNQSGGAFISGSADEDSNQGSRRSVPFRRAKDRSQQSRTDLECSTFMAEFDPGTSEREKRKLKKKNAKNSGRAKPAVYDDKGIIIHFQKDLCDCLEEECPGCHFPCPKCRSCKCGHECRQNRKWQFELAEVDGFPEVQRRNPYLVPKQ